jgi:hypothetical protein
VWRRDGKEETDLGGTGRAGGGGAEASVAEARESFSETRREGKASGAWSRRWRTETSGGGESGGGRRDLVEGLVVDVAT